MPSTYAHYVFGRDILSRYSKRAKSVLFKNLDLYQIGLHGPDILFYYKPLKQNPVRKLGSDLHDIPAAGFFRDAAEVILCSCGKEWDDCKGLSYIMGFIGHFALDSTCHSYVEKKLTVSGVSHAEIEVEFDRYLMVSDGLNPITQHLTGHIRPTRDNAAVISPFFKIDDYSVTEKAIRSFVTYNGLLVAPNMAKRLLIYAVLAATGNYSEMRGMVVNIKPNPNCRDSNLRLLKLMKKAGQRCLRLTENYLDYLDGRCELSPEFDRTFSADENWREIPILSAEEEKTYEV